jgi:hypothetical protein
VCPEVAPEEATQLAADALRRWKAGVTLLSSLYERGRDGAAPADAACLVLAGNDTADVAVQWLTAEWHSAEAARLSLETKLLCGACDSPALCNLPQ